jgi:hypothetical protein
VTEFIELLTHALNTPEVNSMAINVTRETKATVSAQNGGRVLAWTNDKEPNVISVAVPGDRAKLTPLEARELAAYLNEVAAEVAGGSLRTEPRTGPRAAPRAEYTRSGVRVSPWG